MGVRFLGVTSNAVVADEVEVAVPSRASLKPGDLLVLYVGVQAYVGTALTVPDDWFVEPDTQAAGDLALFTAVHYVTEDEEPTEYTFEYGTSKPIVAVMAAYRGVLQDLGYDPSDYPTGYYAPNGSVGTSNNQVAVASISTPSSGSSAFRPHARALLFFCGTHASLTPRLSDVVPFVAIRAKVESAKISAVLCDVSYAERRSPIPSHAVASSVTLARSFGLVRVLESIDEKATTYDSYKAKILRKMFPPPHDASYDEVLGQILTVIGGGDNDVAGLFGTADFLPDEVP